MSNSTSADFAGLMGPVARHLLGEPNEIHHGGAEWRYGTHGSMSIDVAKGVWHDHEAGNGGGVLALIRRAHPGMDADGAREWLRENKWIDRQKPVDRSTSRSAKTTSDVPIEKGRIDDTYDYIDEDGKFLFQVVRFKPKKFRQRRRDVRGDWRWNLSGVRLVIFRLPAVIAAVTEGRTIYIAEGEKGVKALESIGLVGTCSPMGAGKWKKQYNAWFAGADVVILPDNDVAGGRHRNDVFWHLKRVAKRVRVVTLPDLPDKGDVFDWVKAGGTKAQLEALAAGVGAPAATPSPPSQSSPAAGLNGFHHAEHGTPTPPPDDPPPEFDDPAYLDAVAADVGPDPVAALVAEFNDRYMVVNEAGKAVIYATDYDPILRRNFFGRITFDDFRRLYLNRRIRIAVDADGKTAMKPVAEIWLHHPDRRQFIGGVVFDPSGKRCRADTLNLWQGFAVQPRAGSWARLQDHMLRIICAGNREHFDWLMGWMARLVQRPAEQGEVAVVMRGIEGAGKGILAKALLHIFGQHGLAISNSKHLTGNFNGHMRDTVLLFADEAFFAGDKAHVGVLKSLITEPTLAIEAKYQNTVQMPNFVHLMMASNEDWVIPASIEARRFLCLGVLPDRANDTAYFAAIAGEMANGGYEAMLHDLLAYDLTFFNHRRPPDTAALQEQKKLSLPTAEAWWFDVLHRGYVYKSKLGLEEHFQQWHVEMATEVLFASYCEFAKAANERHPMMREAFGRFLVRMGAEAVRPRDVVVGEHMVDVAVGPYGDIRRKAQLIKKDRAYGYSLGKLGAARAAFDRTTHLNPDWPVMKDENDGTV